MENISKKPRLAQETFINDLPDEMLLSIFEYISLHELVVKYSKTCLQWRDIIAQFILRTKILRLAKTNGLFKREIQQKGDGQRKTKNQISSYHSIQNMSFMQVSCIFTFT